MDQGVHVKSAFYGLGSPQRILAPKVALSHVSNKKSFLKQLKQGGISVVIGGLLLLSPLPVIAAEVIAGPVNKVIDGDTIIVDATRIRLFGIDAPEVKQSCNARGSLVSCGVQSKEALERKIKSAHVNCAVKSTDMYGRRVAICRLESPPEDLNAWLVAEGHAVAYRRYSHMYVPLEDNARRKKKGIWASNFQEPEQWRKEHPRGKRNIEVPPGHLPASPPSAAECLIKGNINRKEKVYHLPGGEYYDSVKIDIAAGERWFCTEEQALMAGWRPARGG